MIEGSLASAGAVGFLQACRSKPEGAVGKKVGGKLTAAFLRKPCRMEFWILEGARGCNSPWLASITF